MNYDDLPTENNEVNNIRNKAVIVQIASRKEYTDEAKIIVTERTNPHKQLVF